MGLGGNAVHRSGRIAAATTGCDRSSPLLERTGPCDFRWGPAFADPTAPRVRLDRAGAPVTSATSGLLPLNECPPRTAAEQSRRGSSSRIIHGLADHEPRSGGQQVATGKRSATGGSVKRKTSPAPKVALRTSAASATPAGRMGVDRRCIASDSLIPLRRSFFRVGSNRSFLG